ncbi:hypothetical protein HYFRA_00004478 [Hymenoscyphus fraxineus]|uniref:BTB domain-containing protein n=1 Tax=Hymenoscyphus fraxineus TaxID=746836 RepID=A0A9N9PPF1_9HELO|nr:hypothetical protein HYFRA_00004478 [Hymenoscyphus fraxineus]
MDQQQKSSPLREVRIPEEESKGINQPLSSPTLAAMVSSKPSRQTVWNESTFEKSPTSSLPGRDGSTPFASDERSEVSPSHVSQPQPKPERERTPKRKLKQKRKPLNFCGPQTFTTILTGQPPHQQTFTLHTSLLTHTSSFFRQASNNPSLVETRTQTMKLPNLDSTLFSIIVNYLYTQKILPAPPPSNPASPPSQEPNTPDQEPDELSQLTLYKLHTMAVHLKLPALQNKVVKELVKYEFKGSLEDCITEWEGLATYAFGKEMAGSVLREKALEDLADVYLLLGKEQVREVFLERLFGGAAMGVLGMLLGQKGLGGGEGVERFLVTEEEGDDE